ncbi:DJ-1/PfpI family protein [Bradyrhizobium sp. B124]|uniref:DJ-1/PfpI family protein n=1 Tax=Bradyrhizobium sp. B124 TaxID=3140245 RepID=UPI003183474C
MMASTRFIIHVYDEVEPIDVGATFGVLSMARRVDPGIEMAIVAKDRGVVRLANGLEIIAPYDLSDCPSGDVLMILGGATWPAFSQDQPTLDFIRSFNKEGTVASVCTGALILAGAGLLEGKTATTRRNAPRGIDPPLSQMAKLHPKVQTTEARYVDSGPVITGGGVVLAVDTTLHLIGRFRGHEVAAETARIIEYAWHPNGGAFPTFAASA